MGYESQQIRTEGGRVLLGRVRGIALALPETVEAIDKFSHTSFRIRDKPFVLLGENNQGPWLSIKADRDTQDFLLRKGGFTKTPYIGQHGWVTVESVVEADWQELEALIVDGYVRIAPKRLARDVEAEWS